jgi:hypothetical protein
MKVFIDKRTQDKVMLLSDASNGVLPVQLQEILNIDQVPECIGGKSKVPMFDLISTFKD